MSGFIESICLINGQVPLLDYHQKRVDDTFRAHFEGGIPPVLSALIPDETVDTKQKLRIEYGQEVRKVETIPYKLRKLRQIKKVIAPDELNYAYKYLDRSPLQTLYDQKGRADEILIIKNGLVTDTFYANVAFWDGYKWVTPSSYLLNGVRRQQLIAEGKIGVQKITETDIEQFEKISLINALLDLGESELPIRQML